MALDVSQLQWVRYILWELYSRVLGDSDMYYVFTQWGYSLVLGDSDVYYIYTQWGYSWGYYGDSDVYYIYTQWGHS
jgi:hypothetical protein